MGIFDLKKVDAYLATFTWERKVGKTGQITLGGRHQRYSIGRAYARRQVLVRFDPTDRHFVFLDPESLNQAEEIGQMAKSLTGGISIALFVGIPLLALLIWFTTLYNGLVSKEEAVFESWAQVESNQQRRADLIPNILETVSRYMRFEHETLVDVISERSDAISGKEAFKEGDEDALRESIESLTEAQERSSAAMRDIKGAPQDDVQLEQLYQAQKALGASMHRILALAENYPVLRSAEQMQTLQAELEGSENRINVTRMRFNEAAARFNASIRRMPASLVASLGDFKRKAYFEADEGAEKVIAVEFD